MEAAKNHSVKFKYCTQLQKEMLTRLTNAVREYLEVVEKPQGGRHRRTTLIFVGDRYKVEAINSRFVVPKKNDK